MLGLKEWLEISSDVFGAAGGLLLVAPTFRILKQRCMEQELIKRVAIKYGNSGVDIDGDVHKMLQELGAEIDGYDPADIRWVMTGIWFVIVSFGLKLIFHVITKIII